MPRGWGRFTAFREVQPYPGRPYKLVVSIASTTGSGDERLDVGNCVIERLSAVIGEGGIKRSRELVSKVGGRIEGVVPVSSDLREIPVIHLRIMAGSAWYDDHGRWYVRHRRILVSRGIRKKANTRLKRGTKLQWSKTAFGILPHQGVFAVDSID